MPGRQIHLTSNETYHVFNRGINKQTIFTSQSDYKRIFEIMLFYEFENPRLGYSKYVKLTPENKSLFLEDLQSNHKKVIDVISYCFMPNHFHLLLRQLSENGISVFLANIQNSYTRYFNTKYKKIGPILQGRFKAVYIESEFQLLHVSRYIHLNPLTASICETKESLLQYPWSSFPEYVSGSSGICSKEIVLSEFQHSSYTDFVMEQADYQRELSEIKHLLIDGEEA